MIKCITYWSTPKGLENGEPIDSALAMVRDAGFQGIELCIAMPAPGAVLHTDLAQAQCQAIRQQVDDAGLVCQTLASGMSWQFNPTSDDPQIREKSLELNEAALQRAAWLGCEALLYVPGVVNSPITPDEHVRYDHAIDRAREGCARLLETAERVGVDLCVENVWNGMFYSPLELINFVDQFNHPHLGVYFDIGNVLGYHQRPEHWIQMLGDRIKRIHIKGYRENFGFEGSYGFGPLLEPDTAVPWKASFDALRSIGYDRTIVAELMPFHEGLLEQASRDMDQILSM